ncbi:MAG: CDP-diacylglycerol--glycerol-3-phosphate 3-phosphatidyltransferase [Treponema sp.]|jgi:CDP-diacylglycerol--glycerol-3-phosphate 3-phosphatidyltransferase|nr:CDP-diacylglycerol--glycerol-3-phosphate 3-phosphatidyltransferase [Treponema sp.]
MTRADKITAIRLVLAPVFFVIYLVPKIQWPLGHVSSMVSGLAVWTVPVLWVLFIISEITDLLDGKVARRRKEVSDFGKLFDPLADVLVRITYFLCFVVDGILPVIPLLLILYREFGILFLRILMMRRGIAMGARLGGKIKAVAYMVTGVFALLTYSVNSFGFPPPFFDWLRITAGIVFYGSMVISLLSFADYVFIYRREGNRR